MVFDSGAVWRVHLRLRDLQAHPRLFNDRMPPVRVRRRIERFRRWCGPDPVGRDVRLPASPDFAPRLSLRTALAGRGTCIEEGRPVNVNSEIKQVNPACRDLCERMQMLLVGVEAEDALNALANLMMVALIQASDDAEDADDMLECAVPIMKDGIRANWDEVKAGRAHSHAEGGRA